LVRYARIAGRLNRQAVRWRVSPAFAGHEIRPSTHEQEAQWSCGNAHRPQNRLGKTFPGPILGAHRGDRIVSQMAAGRDDAGGIGKLLRPRPFFEWRVAHRQETSVVEGNQPSAEKIGVLVQTA
jgi:hypothetical protein